MQTVLDPAILFFVFGLFAGLIKSNLEIPQPISRFLSLYLLMALGLKGGFALAQSGLTVQIATSLGLAITLAVLVPLVGYVVLKRLTTSFDAAAIAATYGSVSAVTFITTTQYLETQGFAYGGHMAAAMALMESPAIIIAVVFANALRKQKGPNSPMRLGTVLHESLTDGAQLLLLGAMLVGLATGDNGKQLMAPFSIDLFKGMLAFFLLDMGLSAARNLPTFNREIVPLLLYAVFAPIAHAAIALGLCLLFNVPAGDAALLMVLSASASYIAVPAVIRHAIPEAKPSLYFGLSLGITFPINILIGIPVYVGIAHRFIPN